MDFFDKIFLLYVSISPPTGIWLKYAGELQISEMRCIIISHFYLGDRCLKMNNTLELAA